MQQTEQRNGLKFKTALSGTLWTAGLLLAGSDGPQMPWMNIAGLIIFAAASLVLSRQLRSFAPQQAGARGQARRPVSEIRLKPGIKHQQRINIRYAVEG
jgi:hypothetical protein